MQKSGRETRYVPSRISRRRTPAIILNPNMHDTVCQGAFSTPPARLWRLGLWEDDRYFPELTGRQREAQLLFLAADLHSQLVDASVVGGLELGHVVILDQLPAFRRRDGSERNVLNVRVYFLLR